MNMSQEPAALVGTITGLAAAILTALIAFGVDLDQTQHDALLGLVAVAAPIIAGIVIRGKVYSPETVERMGQGDTTEAS